MRACFQSLIVLSLVGLVSTSSGCPSEDCTSDSECPTGRICRLGLCALDPNFDPDAGPDVADGVDIITQCDPAGESDLVLTEIMADPPSGVDIDGDGSASNTKDEFIEFVNVSAVPVSLANITLDISGTVVQFGPECLAPNTARVVFGSEKSLGNLNNGGETVALKLNGVTIDSHTYGSEGGDDQSLVPMQELTKDGPWVKHTELAPGVRFSPGTCANGNAFPNCSNTPVDDVVDGGDVSDDGPVGCDGPAPVAGDLIVNEVLSHQNTLDANADGAADGGDEFVEFVNVSGATLDISGLTVSENGGVAFTVAAGTCLADGQAFLLFADYDAATSLGDFGSALVVGAGKSSLGLNNTGGELIALDIAGTSVDMVEFGESGPTTTWVRQTDLDPEAPMVKHNEVSEAAMSPGRCQNGNDFPDCGGGVVEEVVEEVPDVIEETADGETVDSIDDAPDSVDATDVGPDDVTDASETADEITEDVPPACGPAPTAGTLVINEILADPNPGSGTIDVNGDGAGVGTEDEFVEIVNLSGGPLDLSGVQISVAGTGQTSIRHTFPQGSCLPASSGVLLFGGGSPVPVAGAVVSVSDITLSLNDGGDEVSIISADGTTTLDLYLYDNSGDGVSYARDPDGTGGFVLHDAISGAVGDFSPGTCTDGATLSSCLP